MLYALSVLGESKFIEIGQSLRFPTDLDFYFSLGYLFRKIFHGEIQLPSGEGISHWRAKHRSIPGCSSGLNPICSRPHFHTTKKIIALSCEHLLLVGKKQLV